MILAVCANPSVDTLAGIETLQPGESQRLLWEKRFPGGKGVHVALALAELGEPVTLLGFWGGPTGSWIRSECEAKGIRCIGPEIQQWNRTCLTLQAPGKVDDTELLGVGPRVRPEERDLFFAAYRKMIPQCKVVTISGSAPLDLEDDFYARLIKIAKAERASTILDGTGALFLAGLAENPDSVHLNRHESKMLTGQNDVAGALRFFRGRGTSPALTVGSEGLYWASHENIWHGRVAIQRTASAVGSGDCLVAGLASARLRNLNAEATVRLAVACGAANCLRPELGMLHQRDVEELKNKIEISTWPWEFDENV